MGFDEMRMRDGETVAAYPDELDTLNAAGWRQACEQYNYERRPHRAAKKGARR